MSAASVSRRWHALLAWIGLARLRRALLALFLVSFAGAALGYWRFSTRGDDSPTAGRGAMFAQVQRAVLARLAQRFPALALRMAGQARTPAGRYAMLLDLARDSNTITIRYPCALRESLALDARSAADMGTLWSRVERRFVLLDFASGGALLRTGRETVPSRGGDRKQPRQAGFVRMRAQAVLLGDHGRIAAALPVWIGDLWDRVDGDEIREVLGTIHLEPLRVQAVALRVHHRASGTTRYLVSRRLPTQLAVVARFLPLARGQRALNHAGAINALPRDAQSEVERQEALFRAELADLRVSGKRANATGKKDPERARIDRLLRLLDAELALARARRAFALGELEEARRFAQQALGFVPTLAEAPLLLCDLEYNEARDFPAARAALDDFRRMEKQLAPEGLGYQQRAADLLNAMRREYRRMKNPLDQRGVDPPAPSRRKFQFKAPPWAPALADGRQPVKLYVSPDLRGDDPARLARAYRLSRKRRAPRSMNFRQRSAAAGAIFKTLFLSLADSRDDEGDERDEHQQSLRAAVHRMLKDHDALMPGCASVERVRFRLFPGDYRD